MSRFYTGNLLGLGMLFLSSCSSSKNDQTTEISIESNLIKPLYITDPVVYDTDDPAIWINPEDPSLSLIIGTDKDSLGGLYVFDLKGKAIDSLIRKGIQRPNNVDVGYGFSLGESRLDFAVTGERITSKLRFFSLPDMQELVPGGISIFEGETGPDYRDLMGVAIYQSPKTGKSYVIAGRKNGPIDGTYLWQYEMVDNSGTLELRLVRKFGNYSGSKEIEAIAVDSELGYIYYSDEGAGVRKYYAEPNQGNEELAFFAQQGFSDDHEGISIYKTGPSTGYILVSDQGANLFQVFPREGKSSNPHSHPLLAKLPLSTVSSDGSEVTQKALGQDFTKGLFVAMSDDKTFQIYRWEDLMYEIEKQQLKK
jgi:3-phytase